MQKANTYLEKVKDILCKDIFKSILLAENCHVSYGWPSKGAAARKNKVIGQAWQQDGKDAIFISPVLFKRGNKMKVCTTLIHELIHIEVGVNKGHKSDFRRVMKEIGLEGKATATRASTELIERLNTLKIPELPELDLQPLTKDKKQGTRLILIICGCGRKLRLSRKVLEEGSITCNNCNESFVEMG